MKKCFITLTFGVNGTKPFYFLTVASVRKKKSFVTMASEIIVIKIFLLHDMPVK